MSEASQALEMPGSDARVQGEPFDRIADALCTVGPEAALEELIDHLGAAGSYRELLDALLLKARHDLKLPHVMTGPLSELPEPARSQYEEKYVDAIRLVGSRYLEGGDIPTAWAYYRVLGETGPVSQAITAYQPSDNDQRLGQIIEVAFNHGVNLRRGFELILEHYGTCPAISAFEQIPSQDGAARVGCAESLIRRLHADLAANLRADIANRGQLLPPAGASIAEMLRGREWLFSDESYHIDVSHLAAVVRSSIIVTEPQVLALAVDLTEYGRRLSPRLQFEGAPPFEQVFADHGIYLGALAGNNVEQAISHFHQKIESGAETAPEPSPAAQALVNLLVRLGRIGAALDVSSVYLAAFSESGLGCPTVAQLCERAGALDRLVKIARERGDLVNFAAALLETNPRY
jgi:hypothetical protein